jgi:Tol biopolymer transport system component
MGEVFRARDVRLDRDVAIKILPAAFAHDVDRLARFMREAKTLASLNHPHVAGVHGLEEGDGTAALVMELVEGEDLSQRVARGAIPIDEALPIAKQIAEALEAAHEQGIIHRDLKPANIKVRADGTVKVLDFGLAKLSETAGNRQLAASGSASMSPTLTSPALMTGAGIILGTAAYMAPEQARGRAVDRRADIWAFGAVLYEMLTGTRPFEAEDVSATLAYVITRDPDWTALPAATPAVLRKLLRRCLEKDPRKRLQSIGDARFDLEEALSGGVDVVASPRIVEATPVRRARSGWPWIAATITACVVAAVATLLAYRATRPIEHPLIRLSDQLEAGISLQGVQGPAVAASPDGSRIAYVTSDAAQVTHLSIRSLNEGRSTALSGTDGADAPFFSPDGRWIAFFTRQGVIKKISVDGGAAVTITQVNDGLRGGGFWADEGTIFFSGLRTPILRVPAAGGTPTPVTRLEARSGPTEPSHRGGQLLPGGDALLFEATKDRNFWEDATIEVQSLETGQRKTLVRGGYFGRYVPGADRSVGHLVYVHGDTLFAAPMDASRLELTGAAVPILQGDLARRSTNGIAHFAVTSSGTMVYVSGGQESYESLYWQDAAGAIEVLRAPPSLTYDTPRMSPDGSRIVAKVFDVSGNISLGVYEWAENRMTRLAIADPVSAPVAWTPDGKHLVVKLNAAGPAGAGLYWMRADGAGEPQVIVSGAAVGAARFTPDGTRLVYPAALPGSEPGLWMTSLDLTDPEHPKAQQPVLFLASKTPVREPTFSPDGRWIAYTSTESGESEVVVQPFPGPGGKWQVSAGGGSLPVWSRQSRELLYEKRRTVMAVSYSVNGDSFSVGQPHAWSSSPIRTPSSRPPDFDLSPDGKRLLSTMPASAASGVDQTPGVTFLFNFADELRRKTRPH